VCFRRPFNRFDSEETTDIPMSEAQLGHELSEKSVRNFKPTKKSFLLSLFQSMSLNSISSAHAYLLGPTPRYPISHNTRPLLGFSSPRSKNQRTCLLSSPLRTLRLPTAIKGQNRRYNLYRDIHTLATSQLCSDNSGARDPGEKSQPLTATKVRKAQLSPNPASLGVTNRRPNLVPSERS